MPEIIAQYAVGAFTTPVDGNPLLAAPVLSNDNVNRAAHNSHDADSGIHLQSTVLASRPAAGTVGRKWLSTDGLRLYYDTGAVWSEIAYLPTAGGTVTGLITAALGVAFTGPKTLAAAETSAVSFETPNTRVYIGDGTGFSLRLSKRVGSVTTDLFQFTDTGIALYGTGTSSVSATAGELVIPNLKYLRGTNLAGTDTFQLIGAGTVSATQVVRLGRRPDIVACGTPLSVVGANVGDFVIGNANYLLGANVGATAAYPLIGLDANDRIRIGATAGIIGIGAPGSYVGATPGEVVLQNGYALRAANVGATATLAIIRLSVTDQVIVGQNSTVIGFGSPGSFVGAAGAELVIPNDKAIRAANVGGTNTLSLIKMNVTDQVEIDANSTSIKITNPLTSSTVGAAGGASALPATPVGYLRTQIGASVVKIPYYTD